MSELKLSWPVTLTGEPPAVISLPAVQRQKPMTAARFAIKHATIYIGQYISLHETFSTRMSCRVRL